MKKSLSLLVAIAMVFSMFATVVSAETTKSAGEFLNELGVIKGDENGDLMEDANWTRQNVAVLMSRLLGKEKEASETANNHGFKDVKGTYYNGFITWAVAEGLFEGNGDGTFGFNKEITNHQFYAVVLRAFKIDTKGDNYAKVPALAKELGLAAEGTDFAAVPTRGATYETIVTALNTEVPGTGKTLGEVLGLIESAKLTAAASVAGVKKVEVKFNKAVKADATFALKLNTLNVAVTPTWSEDKTVATLTAANNFVAGKYTLAVSGLELEVATFEFEVSAEKLTSAKLVGNVVKPNDSTAPVSVQGYNQYNEELSVAGTSFTWSAYNKTAKLSMVVSPTAGGFTLNTTTTGVKVGDEILVTGVHATDASVVVSQTVVISDSAMSEITFGDLVLPTNETRLTQKAAATYYELPYTLKDLAGNAVKLDNVTETALSATINNVVFSTDKGAVLTHVKVENGKLFVKVGANQSGDVKLIATLPAVGKVVIKAITVNGLTKSDNIVLGAQPTTLTAGGTVDIPVTVYDQYGAVVTPANVVTGDFSFGSSNPGVATAAFTADKKSIRITGAAKGAALISITNSNSGKVATFNADVKDAAIATTFEYVVDATSYVVGASNTLKVKVYNQYGGEMTAAQLAGYRFDLVETATPVVGGVTFPATTTAANLKDTGVAINAAIANTSTTVALKLVQIGTPDVVKQTQNVTFKVLATDTALTYSIKEGVSVYAALATGATPWNNNAVAANVAADKFAKDLTILAKDASGTVVAIPASYIQAVIATGDNAAAVSINAGLNKVVGVTWADAATSKEVTLTATIKNPDNTLQVISGKVTVAKEAPKAASIKAYYKAAGTDAVEITDGKLDLTVGQFNGLNGQTIVVNSDTTAGTEPVFYFVVTDQYGVKSLAPIAFAESATGAVVVTVDNAGLVAVTTPAVATNKVTIQAVDAQGNSKIVVISVI